MAVPAVIRYGYGYVQGADAAAQELGTNIDINYFYGGQFYGDANITSRMEGWYSTAPRSSSPAAAASTPPLLRLL